MLSRTFGPAAVMDVWMPATDVYEKDDKYYVTMDLPDVNPDDIEISVTDSTLRVRGERKHVQEVKEENYRRSERFYGTFERIIELPEPVKSEDIEATYKNGMLEIVLPKAEEKKAQEVKIKTA
jgi:HSP20 family protein